MRGYQIFLKYTKMTAYNRTRKEIYYFMTIGRVDKFLYPTTKFYAMQNWKRVADDIQSACKFKN